MMNIVYAVIVLVVVLIILKWVCWCISFLLTGIIYGHRSKGYHFPEEIVKPVQTVSQNKSYNENLRRGGYKRGIVNGICKWVNNKICSIPSHKIRMWCYKNILKVKIADKAVIYKGVVFRDGYKCQIGEGTVIGDDCMIDARGGLKIGSNCNFSTGVHVWTAQHDSQSSNFMYEQAPVIIGDRCWISGGTTVLPGVKIENGCVVASAAVVTKDCLEYGIYAGVPAKRINDRNKELTYEFSGEHDWFL